MPVEDVEILGKAISKLSGYFPIDQKLNFIFTNEEGEYYFKLFVQKKYWNDSGSIERLKNTAEYIEGTGINKRIRLVFIDGWDLSEKEIK